MATTREDSLVCELSPAELETLVQMARSAFLGHAATLVGNLSPEERAAAVALLLSFLVEQQGLNLDAVWRYVEVYRTGHIMAFGAGRAGVAKSSKA